MANIEFSDAKLRSLPPPEKGQRSYWDSRLPSFGIRVSQGGSRTFVLNKNNSLITIGRLGILTLSEARGEAKRLLAERTLGKVRPQSITFAAAKDLFIAEKKKSRRATTVANHEYRLKHFSYKGQLADVTHQDIARRLTKIKTNSEHDHALSVAKTFFTWAHNRRYIDDNPTRGLSPRGTRSKPRIFKDSELKAIWAALDDLSNEVPLHFRAITKLIILLGLRRTECASLRTSFIDGKLATLPAELVKNSSEFTLPLPALALDFLRDIATDTARNDALFFPARGKPDKPFNGWSKAMKALRKALSPDVKHFTLHHFRHNYRTRLAQIGTPPHLAERLVNHISARTDVEKIYDHHKYLPEMTLWQTAYEEHLKTILGI